MKENAELSASVHRTIRTVPWIGYDFVFFQLAHAHTSNLQLQSAMDVADTVPHYVRTRRGRHSAPTMCEPRDTNVTVARA